VERNGGPSEAFLEQGRKQVLPRVLLHVIEAPRPIDTAVHLAQRNLSINDVLDFFSGVAYLKNVGITKLAEVVGLTA
jgi:hypothetical protein